MGISTTHHYTMKYVLLVCLCLSSALAQKWPRLKTTFGLNPFSKIYFHSQPLTRDEAIRENFKPLDDKCIHKTYLGHAYADPAEPSLILLFDDAGNLAGSQSVLLKSAVSGSTVPFDSIPVYQDGSFFGEDAYITTAYFMDPGLICEGGRAKDNTAGDRLYIQAGSATPDNLLEIPMTREEADNELEGWNPHYCFLGMGMHYMTFNYEPDQKCEDVFPLQILYSKGELTGFVWQHRAYLPGDRWEHPSDKAASKIIKARPTCVSSYAANPGLSTLHHYFYKSPQFTRCPFSEMASLIRDTK